MDKISQMKRRKSYHKIYEQIYQDPRIPIIDITQNTGLSRNTVRRYLQEMYSQGILVGPYLRMKPAQNYREYMYLMNFSDPFFAFKGLKGFPHVLCCAITFGDWNIMVVTNRLLDFSQLVGFQSMVARGVKGVSNTPKVEYIPWDLCFTRINEKIKEFTPAQRESKTRTLPYLTWGNDEWKLYHAFKSNMRQKIIPTLRKINVRYDTYREWMGTLDTHCTIHTEFYPEGYKTYLSCCFLFSSNHKLTVTSLFSLFPISSRITDIGDQLFVFTHLPFPHIATRVFCTIYDLKTVEMIKKYNQAVDLSPHDTLNDLYW
ncbi:MAG: winged helix-turn-helix transcriptional regulator [Theionarchaea archaeon]|nr:winged helix-turn-helix transcriptional regulator [Theionarchaea archaeon]